MSEIEITDRFAQGWHTHETYLKERRILYSGGNFGLIFMMFGTILSLSLLSVVAPMFFQHQQQHLYMTPVWIIEAIGFALIIVGNWLRIRENRKHKKAVADFDARWAVVVEML